MFNKGNMSKMLKQAQQMQKQIENVQNELDDLQISGESGGGLINVTVNGKMELLNCNICLLYTSPSPRDRTRSRMPSSA